MGIANLFLSHEDSMRLKDLGFNEQCLGWWSSDSKWERGMTTNEESWLTNARCCAAPTHQQVIEWIYAKSNGELCPVYDPSKSYMDRTNSLSGCIDILTNHF
jgi:hypothetical protein